MPSALGTDPELVSFPGLAGRRIAHFHLTAAALAADAKFGFSHP